MVIDCYCLLSRSFGCSGRCPLLGACNGLRALDLDLMSTGRLAVRPAGRLASALPSAPGLTGRLAVRPAGRLASAPALTGRLCARRALRSRRRAATASANIICLVGKSHGFSRLYTSSRLFLSL